MSRPVVVVGAGLAGLSTACHLAGAGREVVLVEREPIVGGRAGRVVRDGFTFDTGPTVMTMPELLAAPIEAAGSRLEDLIELRRLDVAYTANYADGSQLRVPGSLPALRAEIEAVCGPAEAAGLDDFAAWLEELYAIELPHFIDTNFDSPLDLLARPSVAAKLVAMGGFGRLGPRVRRHFADDRLQKLFSFQAMYAGLPPETALAIYAVITYMDSIRGVYAPVGGMHAVPSALATAAERAGVQFRFGEGVQELLGSGGRLAGVRLDSGEVLAADAVVLTPDLPTVYSGLLADVPAPRAVRRGTYSPSAVVWHVGVRGTPGTGRSHHNIHFGRAWNSAFDDLIRDGRLMRDPSRLVTVASHDDPELAPEGCSTLYVLEPVPNLDGEPAWDDASTARFRDRLHGFLADEGYPSEVLAEEIWTPRRWLAEGMAAGTPFALAHTFAQTGPFRPPNHERRRPGVFFAGSGTVPGVGIPMVLISGRLAAERVQEYLR